jgi:hypothetical protein
MQKSNVFLPKIGAARPGFLCAFSKLRPPPDSMLTNGFFCGKNLIYAKDVEGNLLLKDAPESRRAV